jgi:hypothetical protein
MEQALLERLTQGLAGDASVIRLPGSLAWHHAYQLAVAVTMTACIGDCFRDGPNCCPSPAQQTHRLFLPLLEPPYNRLRRKTSPAARARPPEQKIPSVVTHARERDVKRLQNTVDRDGESAKVAGRGDGGPQPVLSIKSRAKGWPQPLARLFNDSTGKNEPAASDRPCPPRFRLYPLGSQRAVVPPGCPLAEPGRRELGGRLLRRIDRRRRGQTIDAQRVGVRSRDAGTGPRS